MSVSVEIIPWVDPLPGNLLAAWSDLVRTSQNFRAALQTPEWVEYRWRSQSRTHLALLRDSNGGLTGITPLAENRFPLTFSAAARRFGRLHIPGLFIVGNEPLIPESPSAHEALLNKMLDLPGIESVQTQGVRQGTPFWRFLAEATHNHPDWLVYAPEQTNNRYFWIDLPASYQEYLRKFTSKERRILKRELINLEKHAGASIQLQRVTEPEQVPEFLERSRVVAEKSWQRRWIGNPVDQPAARREFLEAMARTGTLRCYLLKAGQHICAYGVGFQVNGVFQFNETAYHEELAKFSCGKSLIQLMLRDLIDVNPPSTFYFGPGDAPYKRWFANRSGDEATLLVVKKGSAALAKIRAHSLYRKAKNAFFKDPKLDSAPKQSAVLSAATTGALQQGVGTT